MKGLFAALAILLTSQSAHAVSGMTNLYVQSVAAWERCTGNTFTPAQAAGLSDLIARHSLDAVTPEELLGEIQRARAILPASCDQPLVRTDREYFEKYVLPRITSAKTKAAPALDTRAAGQ